VTVGELSRAECARAMSADGLVLRAGPFVIRVRSRLREVAGSVHFLYGDQVLVREASGARFTITIAPPGGLRGYVRPQVRATFDGASPFEPLPRRMAAPFVEWGLNWCIGNHAHEFLVIHAAAVERGVRVLMLPAPPGSGKSTLCTALAFRGWRLLSDEFTLVDPETGEIVPVPRPMAVKGPSLQILREWAPGIAYGPEVTSTEGVRVAYARPPVDAVRLSLERARPGWIVLPSYGADHSPALRRITRGRALLHLANNAFNHTMQGPRGFELLAAIADGAPACRIAYPDLPTAVALVEEFSSAQAPSN
jgi:HprK-related kinase A